VGMQKFVDGRLALVFNGKATPLSRRTGVYRLDPRVLDPDVLTFETC
jgi:hypothetical protein